MKVLKHLRNQVILLGLICVAGYVAYEVLLDDKAKQGVRDLTGTVQGSYRTLSGIVNDHIGMIMDEDLVAQNRQHIRDAWAEIGF